MEVQVNQDASKLKGTNNLFIYTDDTNILDRRVQTTKKNTDTLIVVCQETGLEENANKTKYVHGHVSDQNAG